MSPGQLEFKLKDPPRVDVEGFLDEKRNIVYYGDATQQFDGTWRCLANVQGMLCIVQVGITL